MTDRLKGKWIKINACTVIIFQCRDESANEKVYRLQKDLFMMTDNTEWQLKEVYL